jgi:hypothetical protein
MTEIATVNGLPNSVNISSTVTDYDTLDGTWALNDAGGNIDARVDFTLPTGDPAAGTDLQTFNVHVRKNATGGNDPQITIYLWENGSTLSVSAVHSGITTLTGATYSLSWNAASLATADGSLVQCRIAQTSGGTGNPGSRRYIDIDYVEWVVDLGSVAEVRTPATAQLEISSTALTVAETDHHQRTSAAAQLTLDSVAPTVFEHIPQDITVPSANLSIDGSVIVFWCAKYANPPSGDLTLDSLAPTASTTNRHFISNAAAQLVIDSVAPTLIVETVITSAAEQLTLSTTAPTVEEGGATAFPTLYYYRMRR